MLFLHRVTVGGGGVSTELQISNQNGLITMLGQSTKVWIFKNIYCNFIGRSMVSKPHHSQGSTSFPNAYSTCMKKSGVYN